MAKLSLNKVVEEQDKPAAEPKKRPARRSPITGRNVLTVEGKDPNFFYRIFNDIGDRIELMKERGYEVATGRYRVGDRRAATPSAEGSAVTMSVGGGTKGVLMRIPKEFKEEDDAFKEQLVKDTEESMRKSARDAADYGKITMGDKP